MSKMIFDTRQLPPYLTVEQTAAMVQVDVQIVRRMCRSGEIPATKFGALWRIDKNRLIEQLSTSAVNAHAL